MSDNNFVGNTIFVSEIMTWLAVPHGDQSQNAWSTGELFDHVLAYFACTVSQYSQPEGPGGYSQ